MRAVLRVLLYLLAGALVGFLLLGEFALRVYLPLLAALLVLGVVSVIAAVLRRESLAVWSVFLLAAMIVPLVIDARTVALPRCADVPAGIACVASARDYVTPFWMELAIFALAVVGSALYLGTVTPLRPTPQP
jgi:hypothetical protein